MAYALVKAGSVATGTNSVAPTFGQATASSDLLIAWVYGHVNGQHFTVSDVTWSLVIENTTHLGSTAIFCKPNCLATETAPTFSHSGDTVMFAALAEFSGGATSSPVDNSFNGGPISGTITVTLTSADVAAGELLVSCGGWTLTKAGSPTTADSYNNGATPTTNLNNDSSSVIDHYRFAWGTTTGNSAADSWSETNSSMNINDGSGCLSSFKLFTAAVYEPRNPAIDFSGVSLF